MKERVRIFEDRDKGGIEEKVNSFLASNSGILEEIKFLSMAESDENYPFMIAMIIYLPQEEEDD